MERLKFYLGEWDYKEIYPKSVTDPNGASNTGIYTSKLGPGGNSLINTFQSHGPVGDFQGILVFTWDAAENAYKAYVFGSDFPGAIVETGGFEGDALVFRSELKMGGHIMKLRNVTRLTPSGTLESDEYAASKEAGEITGPRRRNKKALKRRAATLRRVRRCPPRPCRHQCTW